VVEDAVENEAEAEVVVEVEDGDAVERRGLTWTH